MKKNFSIKKNYQFKYIFSKGESEYGEILKIIYIKNNKKNNRIGLCVNKDIGTIPLKNRAKRLMRESFRQISLKKGYDIIIMWKAKEVDKEYNAVFEDMKNTFRKLDLLDETNNN